MRFESGPVGGQDVEIRVSSDPVTSSQAANSLLSVAGSEVCGGSGNTIDGLSTMDVCCSKKGRYVTIQGTSTDNVPLGWFYFFFFGTFIRFIRFTYGCPSSISGYAFRDLFI